MGAARQPPDRRNIGSRYPSFSPNCFQSRHLQTSHLTTRTQIFLLFSSPHFLPTDHRPTRHLYFTTEPNHVKSNPRYYNSSHPYITGIMCYEVSYYIEKAKEMKQKVVRPKRSDDGTIHWSPVSSSASSVRSFKSFMSGSSRTGQWSNVFSRKDSPGTPPTPQSPPPAL